MNTVILHIEYLLRRHDCVVLPGWGAFIARRSSACFCDKGETLMLPPSRRLAFNAELREDDGLLTSSVSRREKLTYSEAAAYIRSRVDYLSEQLQADGELVFGNLGMFVCRGGEPMRFFPAAEAVNQMNFGLEAIRPVAVEHILRSNEVAAASGGREPVREVSATADFLPVNLPPALPAASVEEGGVVGEDDVKESLWSRLRRNAVGIAATVAVLLTVGLFFYNPISLDNEPEKASIAPAPAVCVDAGEVAPEEASLAAGAESISEPAAEVYVPVVQETAHDTSVYGGEQSAAGLRFDNSDPYCVVVASFADEAAADSYIASRAGCSLGKTSADGAYRVYEATASTCADAYIQKELLGNGRAWVCLK